MSDKSTSRREESGILTPAELSEVDRGAPAAERTRAADAGAATSANSCVESIVAALVDDESLGRVRQNQKETYVAFYTPVSRRISLHRMEGRSDRILTMCVSMDSIVGQASEA